MILMDGVRPAMDTCILIDYKGHLILNTVDCTSPNGAKLPKNVDIMMSDFAGGASGFPMIFFGGRYTDSWKDQFIKNERKKLLQYKASIVKDVAPKLYIPFAGYFVEAHPSDKYLKKMNLKNDPKDLCNLIEKQSGKEVSTWMPLPGYAVDLGQLLNEKDFVITPKKDSPSKVFKTEWNFEKAERRLRKFINHDIFFSKTWAQFYFDWAGFCEYNLILRIVETDENFAPLRGKTNREIVVDFLGDRPRILEQVPEKMDGRNYLEVKARTTSFRHTIVSGDLWDGLYIGFQCHVSRNPDTFHFKFWDHFQIALPLEPPEWDKFLQEEGIHVHKKKELVVKMKNWTLVAAALAGAVVLCAIACKKNNFTWGKHKK